MRELEKVPVKRMPEVIERAARLQDQEELDLEEARSKGELVRAAQEVGIAPAHIQRAATALTLEGEARAQRRRLLTRVAVVVALLLAVVGGALYIASRPDPAWRDAIEQGEAAWQLKTDPKSDASVTFSEVEGATGQAAAVTVRIFAPAKDKPYVNLAAADLIDLSGHSAVEVRARAEGLGALRVDLEASATERWRSPNQAVGAAWSELEIPLSRFERQTRPSAQDPWRVDTWEPPTRARVVIKLGDTINVRAGEGTPSAKGTVWIDHVHSR